MYATDVRELKKNPSVALRHALDAPVLILKGDQPDALLVHFSRSLSLLILDVKVGCTRWWERRAVTIALPCGLLC